MPLTRCRNPSAKIQAAAAADVAPQMDISERRSEDLADIRLLEVKRFHVPVGRALFIRACSNARL